MSGTLERLENDILSLAATPSEEMMVRHLLQGLRQEVPSLSREEWLLELGYIALALSDTTSKEVRPMV